MKRSATITAVAVSLLPLAGEASAQDRFNRVVEERYRSGQMQRQGEIRNGKKHGLWTYWHENGQIGEKLEFEDGIMVGKWIRWHENGQMRREGECLRPDTVNELTRKKHRRLASRAGGGHQDTCARVGLWTQWYENGRWKSKREYRDGKAHGRHISWCPNGQPQDQFDFVDDQVVVRFSPGSIRHDEWRSDGTESFANSKRSWGNSSGCKRYGRWEEYYVNGQKAVEGNYNHDGERVGEWTLYHPNGQVATQGLFSGWNELKELMCRGTCWDENGKMVNCHIEYAESTSCSLFVSTGTWVRQ